MIIKDPVVHPFFMPLNCIMIIDAVACTAVVGCLIMSIVKRRRAGLLQKLARWCKAMIWIVLLSNLAVVSWLASRLCVELGVTPWGEAQRISYGLVWCGQLFTHLAFVPVFVLGAGAAVWMIEHLAETKTKKGAQPVSPTNSTPSADTRQGSQGK